MHLSALYLFPIKSCAALALDEATVEKRGLAGDRRWMVVDPDGRFMTGRDFPRLTQIHAVPDGVGLTLTAPDLPPLRLRPPNRGGDAGLPVVVWRSSFVARTVEADADAWVGRLLGRPCRLVYMDADVVRPLDARYGKVGDEVSFADGFPMLLIGEASLAELNRRLDAPVSMLRFRPNLVVATDRPHCEDQWRRIRIGQIDFDVVKPCTRCVFTTVDPVTGERDQNGEPLRTLMSYRRMDDGVAFGQNLIPRSFGQLTIGDRVEVLE